MYVIHALYKSRLCPPFIFNSTIFLRNVFMFRFLDVDVYNVTWSIFIHSTLYRREIFPWPNLHFVFKITENWIIEIWQVFRTLNNRLVITRFDTDKIIISNKLQELSILLNKLLVRDVFKNFVYFLETEFFLCPRKNNLFSHYLCFSLRFAKDYIYGKYFRYLC